ncbi:MAG: DUF362 domain-containing protein [Candidatus Methanofastidiosia archaeon]|jgi:uncharacterized protein (DUF362 family)
MSTVAVMHTSPHTVISDYNTIMNATEYTRTLDKTSDTILKLNLSWTQFFPGCSSPPWQVEGAIKTLLQDGFNVIPVENRTVVTDTEKGAKLNKWVSVFKKYGIEFKPLHKVTWVDYIPECELLGLHKIFPEGIQIPELFFGTNVVHLPTLKTHGHTVMTGAIKNSFGGLLKERRHHAHALIHDVLVDLLQIQQEIHTGIYAVMDGTVCGDGAGPRTMVPKIQGILLASSDQVAIDAVAAALMGFDPLKIPFITMCHDKGLGTGDIDQIEVIGEDISHINFGFTVTKSPVIYFDQILRKSFLEPLFHTVLFQLAIAGSGVYHDYIWYPLMGKRKVNHFLKTEWGHLFSEY